MSDAALEAEHTPLAIAERLSRAHQPSYLRDWVYGGVDGAITTLAIVAGVVGADLGTRVILILGLANLLGDGISMAASNYSATKTEIDDYHRLEAIERRHIAMVPDGEREEVRQLLARKGIQGAVLDEVTAHVTADDELWVQIMMQEEHGLSSAHRSPIRAALSTFVAFLLCGMVPLLPFGLALPYASEAAVVATALVFILIGGLKSLWSITPAWKSALETLLIGSAAAFVAYLVGTLLKTLV